LLKYLSSILLQVQPTERVNLDDTYALDRSPGGFIGGCTDNFKLVDKSPPLDKTQLQDIECIDQFECFCIDSYRSNQQIIFSRIGKEYGGSATVKIDTIKILSHVL
jgi:hypothetical protein